MRTTTATILVAGVVAAGCGDSGRRIFGDAGGEPDLAPMQTMDLAGRDLAGQGDGTTIYAHDSNTLFTLDPVTFALRTVGKFNAPEGMTDLAVTPDGSVYTISQTTLYKVDAATGQATKVVAVTSTFNVALTFETDGTLLASDHQGAYRRIDPVAGTVTEIGTYGSGYDSAGDLVAVADGTLYGISDTGPGASTSNNLLLTIDRTTGRATAVGPCGFGNVFGIAYSLGRVLGFTKSGQIIEIDPATGKGTLIKSYPGTVFDGAGVTPLVPVG